MDKLLSIIVPVYNAESYLRQCLDSICNQTYQNLEIILVNDGSKDNSKAICLEYQKKDPRVVFADQKNGGSSIARNTGLKMAKGDIITFVDSDDYLELATYSKMLSLMEEHDLDIVEMERNDKYRQRTFDDAFKIEDNITAFKRIIGGTAFQVWKRIYKRKLVEDMRFIPNIIHQDVFFTIDVMNKVSRIGYLNSPFYNYNMESVGIIRSKYTEMKRDVAIRATEYIRDNVPNDAELKKIVNNYVVFYYTDHFYLLSRNTHLDPNGDYRKKLKNEIKKVINEQNKNKRTLIALKLPFKITEYISKLSQSLKSRASA